MSSLVRTIRRQHGLTLEELAQQTGLTKSYLSKIEREQSNPSITVAIKIAQALGVDVGQLFASDVDTRSLVIDRAENATADRQGFHPLASAMIGKSMTPFVLYPDITKSGYTHGEHSGEELVFVIDGVVDLHHGQHVYTLDTGDSAYFDSAVPHKIRRRGDSARVLVVVCSAPGAAEVL